MRAIKDKKLKSTKVPSQVAVLKCERKNTISLTRTLCPEMCTDSLPAHLRAGLLPRHSWSSYQAFDEVSVRLLFN